MATIDHVSLAVAIMTALSLAETNAELSWLAAKAAFAKKRPATSAILLITMKLLKVVERRKDIYLVHVS